MGQSWVHMSRMWTKEHHERQKALERRRYPTDLTDEVWQRIHPILPQPIPRGRKLQVDLREILNAIRYRTGCGWRMLPHEFGPWQTGGFDASYGTCCSRPCMVPPSCSTGSNLAGRRARPLL